MMSSRTVFPPELQNDINEIFNRIDSLENALESVGTDKIRADIVAQNLNQVTTDVEEIGGQPQSAVDVADKIDQIQDALTSVGTDQLRVDLQNDNVGLSTESTLSNIDSNTDTLESKLQSVNTELDSIDTLLDALENALASTATDQLRVDLQSNNAGTIAVEQQTPVSIENSVGTQIDPITQNVTASEAADEVRVDTSPSEPLDVSGANVSVTVTDNDPIEETTTLASASDISNGVTTSINKENLTIYVKNTGSSSTDITLSYSPNGGAEFYNDPDGPITLNSGTTTIQEIGYDATDIQVTASNTEPCDVHTVER